MTKRFTFLKGLLASALLPVLASAVSMDSRIDTLEKKVAQSTTSNPMDGYGAKNASSMPDTKNTGFHAGLGVIYEQPRVGGSGFAVKQSNSGTTNPTTEEVKEHQFHWGWGLLAEAGYRFDRNWEAGFNYMYFEKATQSMATNSGTSSVLVPTRAKFNIVSDTSLLNSVARAVSDYNITSNSFDVAGNVSFFNDQYFSVGYKGGVRNHWLSLKQSTNYSGGTVLSSNNATVHDKSRFWGIGPVGGLNTVWTLGKGFAFFGDTNIAVLYSRFKNTQEQKLSNNSARNVSTTDNYGRVVPEFDMLLGFQYGSFFAQKRHYVTARIGWDFHYIFGANQMLVNMDSYTTSGSTLVMNRRTPNVNDDMSLQGLRFDFCWEF
jgi:hypothetical protein